MTTSQLESLFPSYDRFFSNYFAYKTDQAWRISVEDNGSYKMELSVPGYGKENVSVKVEGKEVLIDLKREGKRDVKYCYSISPRVDPAKVTASCKNGILTVLFPLREESIPKVYSVNVTGD